MKQAIIAVIAIAVIIGGAVVFGKDEVATGVASNHVYGKADSTVRLVEFADFECPACAYYYPLVEQVKEKYKDQIAFQFKHFPLIRSHQNALAAHRAAEAAGKQGKFWEMYSKLFENQETWNGPSQSDPVGLATDQAIQVFETYAQDLGLDMDQYRLDVASSTTSETINADTAEGKSQYNVTGTPTFVLNGKKIEDTSTIDSLEEFSALIDKELGIETPTSDASTAPAAQPAE
jgi:protein-disulfide isomerase